jgi:hypothetical protein
MDFFVRTFLLYAQKNPGMFFDIMIEFGKELEAQPPEKKEKFLALLEHKIRKRVARLERANGNLRKRVALLEKRIRAL